MLPEEKARIHIDRMLKDAGWAVVTRSEYTVSCTAVAVCEGLLQGNHEADYLLFLDGKAIGILEAKAASVKLGDKVRQQAEQYTRQLLDWYPAWQRPLPFVFVSNGRELLFADLREVKPTYKAIPIMYSPRKLVQLAGIDSYFAALPQLSAKGLRACQYEAINKLEASYRAGEKRALLILATGAGKTFTACTIAYRLLAHTPARRILFLVDRTNLGRQAEGEFGSFRLTDTGDSFSSLYPVARLTDGTIPAEANVVISTIQRLFSMLTGQFIPDTDENDDGDGEESGVAVELPEHLELPPDYFDLIIVDESHRSIYSNWGQVLDYFSGARLLGLTATPIPDTLAYFNDNIVYEYSLEKSILDGINVDYRIFRIETQASSEGGVIKEGDEVLEIKKRTGSSALFAEEEEQPYGTNELNRSIYNPAQMRIILQCYRDSIYTQLFPEREPLMEYIPKTLIFAQSDFHATQILHMVQEVFPNQCQNFVQKITHSSGNSNELIRRFRNDKDFRIAITVNLVATGTDIKPLEVLLFMRDVASDTFYTQMKGRGVRTIGDEQLRAVTPNARSKDCFYLVDAVGVTEHEKTIQPLRDGQAERPLTLALLLEQITHGFIPDIHLRQLSGRLARINSKSNARHRITFYEKAGVTMIDLAERIYDAMQSHALPEFLDVNEPNQKRKALVAPLTHNPKARNYLLELQAGFFKILIPGEDELIRAGFSLEEAQSTTEQFERYVNEHRDEIEALRIIYNNTGEAITYKMLKDLEEKLLYTGQHLRPLLLWNHYAVISPEQVRRHKTENERDALTNLIQLVRYAYKQNSQLRSLGSLAASRFELWCGQAQRPLSPSQKNLMREIANYIAGNGSCYRSDIAEQDETMLAQMVQSFESTAHLDEMLATLSRFILAA